MQDKALLRLLVPGQIGTDAGIGTAADPALGIAGIDEALDAAEKGQGGVEGVVRIVPVDVGFDEFSADEDGSAVVVEGGVSVPLFGVVDGEDELSESEVVF